MYAKVVSFRDNILSRFIKDNYYNELLSNFYNLLIESDSKLLIIGSNLEYFINNFKTHDITVLDTRCLAQTIEGKSISILGISEKQFDYIIVQSFPQEYNLQELLSLLNENCHSKTRIILEQYNNFFKFFLNKTKKKNAIFYNAIKNIAYQEDLQIVSSGKNILLPIYVPGLSWLFNNLLAHLPIINFFCLRQWYILRNRFILPSSLLELRRTHISSCHCPIARKSQNERISESERIVEDERDLEIDCCTEKINKNGDRKNTKIKENAQFPSVSIVVPCRNEKGNIESIVNTIPTLCEDMEIIFIEGHSKDGTLDEIKRVIESKPEKNIKCYVQKNKGKNDAVQLGFEKANNDILMIFDADLTVQAKDLVYFYHAISNNKAEFVNGSRLIYPMQDKAMPWLNFFANHFFAHFVSFILNQKLTDTLCGTKVLFKKDYEKIKKQRDFFALDDPFGDFDLLFGAAKLNLKIIDVPIEYKARTYGTTQVKKFINGLILLKMCIMGFIKFKRK